MKFLRRILCWFGWHGRQVYTVENFDMVARCPHCKRLLRVDARGDLFQ
jgi:hypothetical protein